MWKILVLLCINTQKKCWFNLINFTQEKDPRKIITVCTKELSSFYAISTQMIPH